MVWETLGGLERSLGASGEALRGFSAFPGARSGCLGVSGESLEVFVDNLRVAWAALGDPLWLLGGSWELPGGPPAGLLCILSVLFMFLGVSGGPSKGWHSINYGSTMDQLWVYHTGHLGIPEALSEAMSNEEKRRLRVAFLTHLGS